MDMVAMVDMVDMVGMVGMVVTAGMVCTVGMGGRWLGWYLLVLSTNKDFLAVLAFSSYSPINILAFLLFSNSIC